ncbi:MAG: aminotransferase class V-fold PLP-dependent enzyme [Methylobacter sp.]
MGFNVIYLRPDLNGKIGLECILNALTEQTILVSLMQVNNETGVIQNIDAIAQALKDKVLFSSC